MTGYVPLTGPPTWHQAACAGEDPELFFATDDEGIAIAKAVCGDCDAIRQCGDWAHEHSIKYGIWGGRLPEERGQSPQEGDTTQLRRCDRVDCQRRFKPHNHNQKYCTPECGLVVHRRQQKAAKIRTERSA